MEHHAVLLLNDPLPDLLVEVDFVAGHEPSQFALDGLRSVLEEVTAKRHVTILPATEIPRLAVPPTFESVTDYHFKHFSHREPGTDMNLRWKENGTLHIQYLNGRSNDFVGVYMDGLGITILPDYIRASTVVSPYWTGIIDHRLIERAMLIHEVGHALGLVDCGVPMVRHHHDDGLSRCHSNQVDSVMRYGYGEAPETLFGIVARQDFDPVWQFDEYDRADLAAFIESSRRS